jgi:hypothetical protein
MTAFTDRRNQEQREISAAKKAAGLRHAATFSVTRIDFEARLAEIPRDDRCLTARLMGDPIPGDPRRPWRTA